MSVQGGTLARRGAVHLPMWPVVALLVVAVATPIGLSLIDDVRKGGQAVTSIQETEGYWNSTIGHPALRNRGLATTEYVGISHVAPSLHSGSYASTGYVGISHVAPRSVGYATIDYVGISHVAPRSVGYAGSAEETSGPTTNPCPLACQEARR